MNANRWPWSLTTPPQTAPPACRWAPRQGTLASWGENQPIASCRRWASCCQGSAASTPPPTGTRRSSACCAGCCKTCSTPSRTWTLSTSAPVRGFPPAHPRRVRPAKAGPVCVRHAQAGGAHQAGVRSGPHLLSQVWHDDAPHRLHLPAARQVERHQTDVTRLRRGCRGRQVEKILRHCGLWDEPSARAPPSAKVSVTG
jgi:hypothetical protein